MHVIAEVVKVARCVCSTAIAPQLFFAAWLRNVEGMAAQLLPIAIQDGFVGAVAAAVLPRSSHTPEVVSLAGTR